MRKPCLGLVLGSENPLPSISTKMTTLILPYPCSHNLHCSTEDRLLFSKMATATPVITEVQHQTESTNPPVDEQRFSKKQSPVKKAKKPEVSRSTKGSKESKKPKKAATGFKTTRMEFDYKEVRPAGLGKRHREKVNICENHSFEHGDWHCSACGTHNFARRQVCLRCVAARRVGVA